MVAAAPKTQGAEPPIKLVVHYSVGVDKAGGGNAIIQIAAWVRLGESQADTVALGGCVYNHITFAVGGA